jgi:hypothetical protein
LFRGKPIAETYAKLLHAFYPPDPGSEIRAQETAIGGVIGQPADGSQAKVDGARRELPRLKMDPIPQ